MEKLTLSDNFVYTYLQNKLDNVLINNYTIHLKSQHLPSQKMLQYIVPHHPSDKINISINNARIDVCLPLLRSPFSYTTKFYIDKNDHTDIFKALHFLDKHIKYYQDECYL
jgi:hypothetical protein